MMADTETGGDGIRTVPEKRRKHTVHTQNASTCSALTQDECIARMSLPEIIALTRRLLEEIEVRAMELTE